MIEYTGKIEAVSLILSFYDVSRGAPFEVLAVYAPTTLRNTSAKMELSFYLNPRTLGGRDFIFGAFVGDHLSIPALYAAAVHEVQTNIEEFLSPVPPDEE